MSEPPMRPGNPMNWATATAICVLVLCATFVCALGIWVLRPFV